MTTEHELKVLFVELLDEGTESYRPVIAEALDDGLFRILALPEYSLLDEHWAVEPGALVRVQATRTFSGKEIPLAVPAGPQALQY